MQNKLQIVFRGIDQSDAIEGAIHKKVENLSANMIVLPVVESL